MDLLDYLTQWREADAALKACRERCVEDVDYFCALPIEREQEARLAFHHELHRVIAARIASL